MDKLIDKFIEYLDIERNYSYYTCINYQNDLIKFYKFLQDKKITNIKNVTYQVIRDYLNYLYIKKEATKSVTRNISSLRSFFHYLQGEGIIESNPMTLVSNPKQDKKLPHYLTYDEIEELLRVTSGDDIFDIRDNMIIELLYSTGLRVGELVNIKISDINFNDKSIKVLGKGSKERIVYFGTPALNKLRKYLSIRPNIVKDQSSLYLLINKRGNKLQERAVRSIFENIIKKNHLKIEFSPHTLRHTFATHMLNEGMDIKSVQELLGHSSISTTGIYTHVSNEHLRSVYLSAHPRSRKDT